MPAPALGPVSVPAPYGHGPGRRRRRRDGQETDLTTSQQGERVQVGTAAQQTPVQAGPFRAVTWFVRHRADRLGGDRIAAGDGGLHR
ncbi:hypothetical protein [Nocardiopsis sp. NPDC006832]|uniref:hypothetical protein n=1 Tax=Nocardiopsis sp. NPDC006832 TaxID=3157188 RepID=UPI0033DBCF94